MTKIIPLPLEGRVEVEIEANYPNPFNGERLRIEANYPNPFNAERYRMVA